jgi:hypothetical protein
MNELSRLIKNISNHNTPSISYFENFLPCYKAYHKRQNVKRTVYKICTAFAIIVVFCLSSLTILDKLHQKTLDIPTAAGVENESK